MRVSQYFKVWNFICTMKKLLNTWVFLNLHSWLNIMEYLNQVQLSEFYGKVPVMLYGNLEVIISVEIQLPFIHSYYILADIHEYLLSYNQGRTKYYLKKKRSYLYKWLTYGLTPSEFIQFLKVLSSLLSPIVTNIILYKLLGENILISNV